MTKKPDCAWNLTDLKDIPQNGLKIMTTFACGGGSSMGYKRAGCEVIAANDIDPEMAFHYKLNVPPRHYFLNPIRDLLDMELPAELMNLDILDGSPPCSTFSTASVNREASWGKDKHFREGQAKQVLSDLFFDYLDVVDRLKPKVAIAENVVGMIQGNAKGYTKLITARFKEIGYRPQLFLINGADCGVPQKRRRVFFCALRDDISGPALTLNPQHRWVSAGEATRDLQELTEAERATTALTNKTDRDWWHRTPPGKNFSYAVEKMGMKSKLWNHTKLNSLTPANALTATDMASHWGERRHLTFREWKRLGSFPDDYQAKTDKIGKYMVGMSVPPRMAEVVARAVCAQWLQPGGP